MIKERGKRLVDDEQALAFVQTQKARVMFTPSGAYMRISVPVEDFEKPRRDAWDRDKRMDQDSPGIQTRTVVLKAGFSNAQPKKRRVTARLEEITSGNG